MCTLPQRSAFHWENLVIGVDSENAAHQTNAERSEINQASVSVNVAHRTAGVNVTRNVVATTVSKGFVE
uniref:Uncharacterized protein n=1 Tax=Trichobilharzia regenti TaxID=157069 RepID=A0AA85KJE5_TRIRE|nr:unnamed protein product [Trichobilharzia regenti]